MSIRKRHRTVSPGTNANRKTDLGTWELHRSSHSRHQAGESEEPKLKKYYRDFYGCTASLRTRYDGSTELVIRTHLGGTVLRRTYDTEHGARIAMGQYSDCWTEQKRR